ncbi:hypothetical protein DSM106972_056430 [Dulcicalothrix desertica PCC 7102]|uniref:Uncharacterized protein n=1 Tax=Dulcicalothrix desertica PCC 7102 TaxID=232991 RepID=A0A3S1CJC9_9CYAN|nr:hypothetical protein [Dulcicalothrix desertica]RUT02723.1 hypothetical protein DSM106972_056430 [Dulcicalothrix desertica PCC 7102]TWH39042.1 hypothetical protein CAL7102_08246 [Dulcicalothrix desertica PCC 7102]
MENLQQIVNNLVKEHSFKKWIYAQVRHLPGDFASRIFSNPDLLSQYVSSDYCGEHFEEDVSVDLPKDCSEEILKVYRQGYNRGYHRGIDRIKPGEN